MAENLASQGFKKLLAWPEMPAFVSQVRNSSVLGCEIVNMADKWLKTCLVLDKNFGCVMLLSYSNL